MTETAANDLSGRLAVVTGASSGIGRATALRLAARGMRLALGARRLERLQTLAAEIEALPGGRPPALAFRLDVRHPGGVAAFAGAVRDFAGPDGVSVLVNNAGLARGVATLAAATARDEADWEEVIDTNLTGMLRVTRAFLPAMAERGSGHVVNIGSLAGIETYEGGAVYCASKAGVRVLSRAMRLELLGRGVRVTCINPGLVSGNEFSRVRLGSDERAAQVYRDMTPLDSNDVAAAIEWIVSLPAHVNIEELNLQPLDQASAQKIARRPS